MVEFRDEVADPVLEFLLGYLAFQLHEPVLDLLIHLLRYCLPPGSFIEALLLEVAVPSLHWRFQDVHFLFPRERVVGQLLRLVDPEGGFVWDALQLFVIKQGDLVTIFIVIF